MKKLNIILLTLSFIPAISFAKDHDCSKLDTLNYTITSEKTIKANDAAVIVELNATIVPDDLSKVQQQTKEALNKITNTKDWDTYSYTQNKTPNDLINVDILFKNRLTSDQINNLTTKLPSLSSNGKKYQISSIDYKPTLEQIENTKNDLRLEMLAEAKEQTKNLNQKFDEKYTIHNITFSSYQSKQIMRNDTVNLMGVARASNYSQQPMDVATEITLNADIKLAKPNS